MSATTTPPPPVGRAALMAAARAELADHGHAVISLRAVARRAGVSHAAPKYHFEDRAGLLTAVAVEGYDALNAALDQAVGRDGDGTLTALGRAYIDFGLVNPALFDLMFRPSELHPDDPALRQAKERAIGMLTSAVDRITSSSGISVEDVTELALTCWALVHGLVVLTRDGALGSVSDAPTPAAAAHLSHRIAEVFTARTFPVPASES